jgi:aarF domain-containing kinase
MFKRVHLTTLASLQALDVMKEMLEVIRSHNMKIDGEISILLTNMLVLEAIAKDLDPNINILRCAVPYLHYKT